MTCVVFGQGKQAAFDATKGVAVQKTILAPSGVKAPDTDTLTNIDIADNLTIYTFGATTWGTWSGHNQYQMTEFAEKFTNTLPGEVNGAIIYAFSAYSAAAGRTITVNVYADGATPGAILGSKTVNISDLVPQDLNDITFDTPVPVTGNFYIGYTISYGTPVDTFSVVMAESTPTRPATAYLKYNSAWTSHNALSSGALNTSLAIFARCALTVPTTPTAQLTPTAWNAGDIENGQSATSGSFTLTNIGQGTLTCSGITGLSAPFTTSLVPASVSLAQGASATFTFTFAPTATNTYNQTATIATNGGNVTVALTGMSHDPYGNMLGTFENIPDWTYQNFPGWAQIDLDLRPTYGFTGITFTNSGYVGSYIIFNPATTTPDMTTDPDIQPHAGAKFAACMDAVPTTGVAANNDWLITPQSAVITAGSKFKAWVKTYVDDWGLERYAIWVSTTGTAQANFTKISAGNYLQAPIAWTQIEYNLDAYVGQQIYVAIQCVSADAFIFMLDDVEFDIASDVHTPAAAAVAIFPNPTDGRLNILNAENVTVEVYNVLGSLVMTENNVTSYIDLSSLAAGSYYVKVNTGSKVYTQKVNLTK
jgi:hypothetical protein